MSNWQLTDDALALLVKAFDDANERGPAACACSGPVWYTKAGPGKVHVTMPYCWCQRNAYMEQAVRELHRLRLSAKPGQNHDAS